MTDELLERLVREAGFSAEAGEVWIGDAVVNAEMRRFAALVAEECAKECERLAAEKDADGAYVRNDHVAVPQDGCDNCADAIREKFGLPARD